MKISISKAKKNALLSLNARWITLPKITIAKIIKNAKKKYLWAKNVFEEIPFKMDARTIVVMPNATEYLFFGVVNILE